MGERVVATRTAPGREPFSASPGIIPRNRPVVKDARAGDVGLSRGRGRGRLPGHDVRFPRFRPRTPVRRKGTPPGGAAARPRLRFAAPPGDRDFVLNADATWRTDEASSAEFYTVRSGDTLAKIAAQSI